MSGPRVVLWRHGRTEWNAQGRFQGQLDIDLDDVGREQAKRSAAILAALAPDLVVSSDLRRARHSAAPLGELTGLSVRLDPDLRETNAGDWQGLTAAEIEALHPDQRARWQAGDPDVRVGGGETRREVGARMARAVERHVEALPDSGLAVLATHGGAARLGIATLLDLPTDRWRALGGLSNACWSMLSRRRSGWMLVEHNAGTLPQPVTVQEG